MDTKKRVGLAFVVIALALGSYYVYLHFTMSPSDSLQASGTIEATTIELNARSNGTLKLLPVREGTAIKAGQLVAELSRDDLLAQKERDAMGVIAAEAHLRDLTSGARAEEINEANLNVEIVRDKLSKATSDLERATRLQKSGALSSQEWEKIKLEQENLTRQLEVSENRLALLAAGNRSGIIAAAAAEVERSRAVLKASDSLVRDLKIYAPQTGTLLSKNFEVGEYVSPGATLATLADLTHLWIKVFIPTDDLPRIKLDQKVKISVTGSKRVFAGRVSEIASRGEYTPKMIQTQKERANVVFAVKIEVDNGGGILKPGMPADVVFSEGQKP